jgi:putative nucleotidyltransferase with HDIG domain
MIQCATLALEQHSDEEVVLGALLHDIGHLLKHEMPTEDMGGFGVVNHEGIGARYLKEKGFSDRVCAMVEMHVQAKRYLVATDPSYQEKLSEASWQTLNWQGGPMSNDEIEAFRKQLYFDDIIKVRLWDEQAKERGRALPSLSYFRKMIHEYLTI